MDNFFIDRKDFVLEQDKDIAYEDRPLSIGYGATISQPSTVYFMLELLGAGKKDKVLDIGSGSGWTTALLAKQAKEVWGTEITPELAEWGKNNLAKYNFKNSKIVLAKELGLPEKAPFDKILVSASAEELSKELIRQLKIGGRMIIPIKNSIWKIDKLKGGLKKKEYPGFVFVPLQ